MSDHINKYINYHFEEGICIGMYSPGSTISLPIAQEIVRDRLALFQGNSYPCMIDSRGIKTFTISREARDFLAKGEGTKGVKAIAILADTTLVKMIANVYLTFNKPDVPAKVFNDKEKAVLWLKKF